MNYTVTVTKHQYCYDIEANSIEEAAELATVEAEENPSNYSFHNSMALVSKDLQNRFGINPSDADNRAALFLIQQVKLKDGNTSLGHYDHKNLEHIDMIAKATARFNELYIDKVDEYKPGDPALMTDIMKTLKEDVKTWTQLPPPPATQKTWAKDLQKGKLSLKADKSSLEKIKVNANTEVLMYSEVFKDPKCNVTFRQTPVGDPINIPEKE